ncbi:hypothetical protein [Planomicrobium okeanokoites]|uniref:Uncharacterized protein n=1 Tax=Planomicrobium okeanokoites TaxID=244 RepID=A0ABV7KLE3_PLAOK|nr:hypothetical protein [Planomicrobium okeanokoites]TAA69320.1 hypothetical protein D2910_08255 [Planomicrobium okeanokoites]
MKQLAHASCLGRRAGRSKQFLHYCLMVFVFNLMFLKFYLTFLRFYLTISSCYLTVCVSYRTLNKITSFLKEDKIGIETAGARQLPGAARRPITTVLALLSYGFCFLSYGLGFLSYVFEVLSYDFAILFYV